MRGSDDLRMGPARDIAIAGGSVLGMLGAPERLREFATVNGLLLRGELETFAEQLAPTKAGIAEVVIPPGSNLIGKSARDVWMRKRFGLSLTALHRGGNTFREGEGVRDMPLQAGRCADRPYLVECAGEHRKGQELRRGHHRISARGIASP